MWRARVRRICVFVLLPASVLQLAGCASDPRYKQGVNWVVENEAQKAQLNAMGFPQYGGPY